MMINELGFCTECGREYEELPEMSPCPGCKHEQPESVGVPFVGSELPNNVDVPFSQKADTFTKDMR
jgi:hypothetical protein